MAGEYQDVSQGLITARAGEQQQQERAFRDLSGTALATQLVLARILSKMAVAEPDPKWWVENEFSLLGVWADALTDTNKLPLDDKTKAGVHTTLGVIRTVVDASIDPLLGIKSDTDGGLD